MNITVRREGCKPVRGHYIRELRQHILNNLGSMFADWHRRQRCCRQLEEDYREEPSCEASTGVQPRIGTETEAI